MLWRIQGDIGLPGPAAAKGEKGEKGGIGLPGRRVSVVHTPPGRNGPPTNHLRAYVIKEVN